MNKIKIGFFGGVDEFGENLTCYLDNKDGFLVDFGAMFPDYWHHGVTYFYPDYSFILKNYNKFKVLVVTHGHEDHIGGIVNLVNRMPLKIIASKFTISLIKKKLSFARSINFYPVFEEINDLDEVEYGDFKIKFIENDHSIINSYSLKITHNDTSIFHSADFKIDKSSDKSKKFLKNLDKYCKNVDIALIDSTNATVDYDINMSEKNVKEAIQSEILNSENNVFITMFSSNIERVLNIIDISNKVDIPIVLLGRSLEKYISLAEDSNIEINRDNILLLSEYFSLIKEDETLQFIFIIAGSQGELTSALTSLSFHQYKGVFLKEGDTVIYSSKTIPGNEKDILKVKNQILKKGSKVFSLRNDSEIHASGHTNAEGLREVLHILQPKYLIPIHGTVTQQGALEDIALEEEIDININNILTPTIGDIFSYHNGRLKISDNIDTEKKFLDITGIDDMDISLIKKRDKLKLGIAIISLTIDKKDWFVLKRPTIKIEGFVDSKYLSKVTNELEEVVFKSIDNIKLADREIVEPAVILASKRFFRKKYKVSPQIFLLIDYI